MLRHGDLMPLHVAGQLAAVDIERGMHGDIALIARWRPRVMFLRRADDDATAVQRLVDILGGEMLQPARLRTRCGVHMRFQRFTETAVSLVTRAATPIVEIIATAASANKRAMP